ncbi:unnamed protein product [Pleuronectes platessa]|uniref:Uncharacterized protein n=1 Tax=Pleuronectes platessa TaxID=8262 RepID=A0A9N7V2K5_PLEPL|nr:unnamed protein product [Pleuronectes platessa]
MCVKRRRRRRRRMGMKGAVARGRGRQREVAGGETDAPALLVMLAVSGLPACDRRGRRTSRLSSAICSVLSALSSLCPVLLPPRGLIPLLFPFNKKLLPPPSSSSSSSPCSQPVLCDLFSVRAEFPLRPGGSA